MAETCSRGWAHTPTRQNIQLHFVQLENIPQVMRDLNSVGLTTREACGDTVRNITGCHLAGACPYEVLDISPWAEATFRHLLRNPYSQRLPRKFKINFSGCTTDCGQAMFNDVGIIAVMRPRPDGTLEPGFRVFFAGGLGANPHAAQPLEQFTPLDDAAVAAQATSAGPSPPSSGSCGPRAESPIGRTSCSAALPRSSCPRCTPVPTPSAWRSRVPSSCATSSAARARTHAISPSPS